MANVQTGAQYGVEYQARLREDFHDMFPVPCGSLDGLLRDAGFEEEQHISVTVRSERGASVEFEGYVINSMKFQSGGKLEIGFAQWPADVLKAQGYKPGEIVTVSLASYRS